MSVLLADFLSANYVVACGFWAMFALSVYEYIITLDSEVAIFWRRRATATSLLFISTRWTMLLVAVVCVVPTVNASSCSSLSWTLLILICITYAQAAVFSALRVFATLHRSYAWASVVLALGLVVVIANMYAYFTHAFTFAVSPVGTCIQLATDETESRWHWTKCKFQHSTMCRILLTALGLYITRASLLAADTVVLVLTWLKTFRLWRDARLSNENASLMTCLLRDGTWYFLILAVINLVDMVVYHSGLSPAILTLVNSKYHGATELTPSPVGALLQTVPSILMNRFMINLHSLGGTRRFDTYSQEPRPTTLSFREPETFLQESFLGNIGEDLDFGYGSAAEDSE